MSFGAFGFGESYFGQAVRAAVSTDVHGTGSIVIKRPALSGTGTVPVFVLVVPGGPWSAVPTLARPRRE